MLAKILMAVGKAFWKFLKFAFQPLVIAVPAGVICALAAIGALWLGIEGPFAFLSNPTIGRIFIFSGTVLAFGLPYCVIGGLWSGCKSEWERFVVTVERDILRITDKARDEKASEVGLVYELRPKNRAG